MSTQVRDLFMRNLGDLRYEPIEKRIRGTLGGRPVVDSSRAMLVWEPKRVVPSYAVPIEDIDATVTAAASAQPSHEVQHRASARSLPPDRDRA